MSKAGQIPYSWEQIEDDIRRAILVQANVLGYFGPDNTTLMEEYLGLAPGSYDCEQNDFDIEELDIARHHLHRYARAAYVYAYQLDGAEEVTGEDWFVGEALLDAFPQNNIEGEPSPLSAAHDFPLRRVIETFGARWSLNNHDGAMNIRQLSLLADMTIPAVRTSLSKEGFRLEKHHGKKDDDANFALPAGDALVWLSRRRGFIPNRAEIGQQDKAAIVAQIVATTDEDFGATLPRILAVSGQTVETLSRDRSLDAAWLAGLFEGASVTIDVEALRALARTLEAPEADFVGRAVTYLLRREAAES